MPKNLGCQKRLMSKTYGHVYFVSLQPAGHRRHDMDVSKLLHIDEEHKVFTV